MGRATITPVAEAALHPYRETPVISSTARGLIWLIDCLPFTIYRFAFRTILALPPTISRPLVYWLTQPEYKDIPLWREIRTAAFSAGLMQLGQAPSQISKDRITILYIHGGAGIVGHARMFSGFCREILTHIKSRLENTPGSNLHDAQLLSVDYILAGPRSRHPVQCQEIAAAYQYLISQGVREQHIIIAGDSAGAFLALRTAMDFQIKAAGVLLVSPWVKLTHKHEDASWKDPSCSSDIITSAFLRHGVRGFLSPESMVNWQTLSPYFNSAEELKDLPRTMTTYGGQEKLADSIRKFATALPNNRTLQLSLAGHDWVVKKTLVHPKLYAERSRHLADIAAWICESVQG